MVEELTDKDTIHLDIMNKFEDLVLKRFKSLKEIKEYLQDLFKGYTIEVNFADMSGVDQFIDYDIVGLLDNEDLEIYCYFDIYFAKTRNKEMFITEVSCEFE